MGHKAGSPNVGCKVLPICDSASTGSNGGESSNGSEKDVRKGQPRKAVSRMKELLRWAAAAKSHKGGSKGWKKVFYFQKSVALKAQVDDTSSNSSRSFRWDVGGCSTSSSVYSPVSLASMSGYDQTWAKNSSNLSANFRSSECDANASSKTEDYVRTGHWITTDSDCDDM
ncbi:uncharacterized protein LOC120104382 isoform X2 [Phoenix dactylifera]|uniref:Uncharacterized protein LOC120104382 isoform X2 n=1 Tax=Phoenix dactylifera TaxID=42345 RepID=A0A8B8ZB05_PHODC|nr:uncharacterized protein LOC120104382 isoform X2 [Phoenix dactylifera]